MVYDPEEDSYVLEEVVKKVVKPQMFVCDMGTGSGIQAIAAAKAGARTVLAVDIDNEALDYVMQEIKEQKLMNVRTKHSDLFQEMSVHDVFDVIIFNAPYLPDDKDDPDLALDGGAQGHELIARFLKDAKKHLAQTGKILLLFSTQSGFGKVLEAIADNDYVAEQMAEVPMFFERLYVYQLQHKT